ncbi:Heavy-metal-associated domain protein [Pirellulimonas nuda]|uniref:Heavy-metal-associated domain protein n=1 Tax=Pirellulimonas nuda TaxID=2528009 RepID=A0A518DCI5_9BACT|nr:heavy metal-associated domain-containing protein [Pirellulimonas nuda]QDU89188.1 Heavy-metal-associated domain protein [Pirellulimonas nuda]
MCDGRKDWRWLAATLALGALCSAPAVAAPVRSVEIVVEKMCCQGCARKVAGSLYTAKGVRGVEANVAAHTVTVQAPAGGAASLGALWEAVVAGDGGPTEMRTAEAVYRLTPAEDPKAAAAAPFAIRVENLHCQECAQKIATQLYGVKGVKQVSVTMNDATLFVQASAETRLCPWAAVDVVSRAGERAVAVTGPHGELTVEWAAEAATPSQPRHAVRAAPGGNVR